MKTTQEKLSLITEAVCDWKNKRLDDGAALFAISFILFDQPPITQHDIDTARKLFPEHFKQ